MMLLHTYIYTLFSAPLSTFPMSIYGTNLSIFMYFIIIVRSTTYVELQCYCLLLLFDFALTYIHSLIRSLARFSTLLFRNENIHIHTHTQLYVSVFPFLFSSELGIKSSKGGKNVYSHTFYFMLDPSIPTYIKLHFFRIRQLSFVYIYKLFPYFSLSGDI